MTWQDRRDARVTRCSGCGVQVYGGDGLCESCKREESGL